MKSTLLVLLSIFLFVAAPSLSTAAALKTYVAEFGVVGAPNKDELKVTLQGMLASRLNPNRVLLVENQDKAELLVSGSYALFGKIFSLDVLLKNNVTGTMTKVFEQGEGQDDLIPAMGRLAQKVEQELAKLPVAATPPPALPVPLAPPALPAAAKVAAPAAIPAEGYAVRPEGGAENAPGSWTSEPLEGVFTGIALGRKLPSGEQEIFVADDHSIRSYLKGADLKLVAEVTVPVPAKILAIDTADLDGDGLPELYATIMDREALSSQVYRADGATVVKIAEGLPWIFRGIGQTMKARTIFVQELGTRGEFYGGVSELVKSGDRFEARNQMKLPRSGTIFNFNLLTDASGKKFTIVLNEDGYLVVSNPEGKEVWKSSDKFGGSESFFKRKDYAQIGATGDQYRWTFLEQRMVSLPDGTVLVPRNEGTFNLGYNRSYNKHAMFALQWNGAVLKEKWHSRPAPSYLADFAYDAASRELVLLEVIQKSGFSGKGSTVISINRID